MEGLGIISSDMGTAWLGLHRGVLKVLKESGQQWPEWGRQPCSAHLDALVGVQWAGGFPAPGFAVGCRCLTLLRCFGRFHWRLYHCPCHVVPAIWDRKKCNRRVTQKGRWLEIFSLLSNCPCTCLTSSGFHQKNTAHGNSQEWEVLAGVG